MDLIPDPPDPAPDEADSSSNLQQRLQITSTVVTLCVALLAIGLTVWQGYEMRRHNRLTVQPYLKTNSVVNYAGESVELTYSLESNGLGPAVYSQILVFDREAESPAEPIRVSGPDDTMINPMVSPDFLGQFAAAESLGIGYTNAPLRHRYVHPTGQEVIFLTVRLKQRELDDAVDTPYDELFDGQLESAVSRLQDSLRTKSYVICYCSVYSDNCGQVSLVGYPPRDDVCRNHVEMAPLD